MRPATDQSHHATILAQCVSVLIGLNSLLHTSWKDHERNEIVSNETEENIADTAVRLGKTETHFFQLTWKENKFRQSLLQQYLVKHLFVRRLLKSQLFINGALRRLKMHVSTRIYKLITLIYLQKTWTFNVVNILCLQLLFIKSYVLLNHWHVTTE